MKKETTLKKLHGNVEDTNNTSFFKDIEVDKEAGTEAVTYAAVENTPFTIAKHENNYYVLMGMHKLSNAFESEEEALADAKRTDWDRLLQVVGIAVEVTMEYHKNKQ